MTASAIPASFFFLFLTPTCSEIYLVKYFTVSGNTDRRKYIFLRFQGERGPWKQGPLLSNGFVIERRRAKGISENLKRQQINKKEIILVPSCVLVPITDCPNAG